MFFFDGHGGLWKTCSGDDSRSVAFGPTGIAREATREEADLPEKQDESPWTTAANLGRMLERDDGWFILVKKGQCPFGYGSCSDTTNCGPGSNADLHFGLSAGCAHAGVDL